MSQQRTSRKPKGHPGPNGRPNGHDPAYAERGGVPALRGQAASDDAGGIPVANVAALPAAANLHAQVSTVRQACAEAAPPPPNETATPQAAAGNPASNKMDKPEKALPPGKYPLPDNPAEFVEEIHGKVDFTEVWHSLLRSKDEMVKQRATEKLTGMFYEDGALSDDDQQIIFDLPRPKRD